MPEIKYCISGFNGVFPEFKFPFREWGFKIGNTKKGSSLSKFEIRNGQ
jgi:hypothetical protein